MRAGIISRIIRTTDLVGDSLCGLVVRIPGYRPRGARVGRVLAHPIHTYTHTYIHTLHYITLHTG
jgi:hypothetical protein